MTAIPPGTELPEGWSADPSFLKYDSDWVAKDMFAHEMAQTYKLNKPKPLMRTTPDSGEFDWLFVSDGDFYIWDEMGDLVFKITKPKSLAAIIKSMREKGEKSLKLAELEPKYDDE